MEEGAAELAVGDALEPDVLLALRHLADAVVLDPAQGLAGDLARRVLLARLDEAPGPQKAADVVGAEGALHGHPDVSWFSRLLVGPIGRASCRARGCQYGEVSVVALS